MPGDPRAPRRRRGLTLIETCVTTALAVVVVAVAAPGLAQLRERAQLRAVAALLETDIAHARGLAAAANRTLRLEFHPRCWVLHAGAAGACRCDAQGTAACTAAEALHAAGLGERGVALRSNSASIAFDATRGTVTPTATITLQSPGGTTLRGIVNVMGRVRTCSPDGVPGYPAC